MSSHFLSKCYYQFRRMLLLHPIKCCLVDELQVKGMLLRKLRKLKDSCMNQSVVPFITDANCLFINLWGIYFRSAAVYLAREGNEESSIMLQTHGNRFVMNIYRLTSLFTLTFLTSKSYANVETSECSTLVSELASELRRCLEVSFLQANAKTKFSN